MMLSLLSACLTGAFAVLVHGIPAPEPTQAVRDLSGITDPLCHVLHCPVETTITVTDTKTETQTETKTKTETETETAHGTVTVTETTAVTPTSTPSSCPTKPDLDPLPCDPRAYLVQANTLLVIDLATGKQEVIAASIRPSAGTINAMGFNPLEGYLYAFQGADLIRIGLNGTVDVVLTLPTSPSANVGEFDLDGQYYYSRGATTWGRVDFFPGSPTYGQLIESGTMTLPSGVSTADWAFTPAAPGYLHAIGTRSNGALSLIRWSITTHKWDTLSSTYKNLGVTPTGFGAIVGTSDGFVYGSDNGSGRLFRFSVLNTTIASLAGKGTPASSNEGARCFLQPDSA